MTGKDKQKKYWEIIGYNKLNFYQLFDVTFELEGTRKLPLSTE